VPIDCEGSETRDIAYGLLRVLNDEGDAVGEWNPNLDSETMKNALQHMIRIRAYDDRMMMMQRQGRLSFYMKCLGEEAVSVGAAMAMEQQDIVIPSYRQQGLLFVRGRDMVDMICHCISNSRDNVKGRQMPVHYSWKEGNFVSISSPVGTQFPQAVGAAMAFAYRGEDSIACSWLGEGTSAQGDFHYGLNFASVYKAPCVLVVVNNQWAISTHRNIAHGGESFAGRGIPYGVASMRVDGQDFLAVYAAHKWATERARAGHGPTLLEMYTYRGDSHSSSDDPSIYRPSDEYENWPLGDPIDRLKGHLEKLGEWDDEQHQTCEEICKAEVTAAYKEAEKFGTLKEGPFPPRSTLFEDVYEEEPWHLLEQRGQVGI
jgi:2-oxoisovalerate dehydrogenase E1 component alpha subunit